MATREIKTDGADCVCPCPHATRKEQRLTRELPAVLLRQSDLQQGAPQTPVRSQQQRVWRKQRHQLATVRLFLSARHFYAQLAFFLVAAASHPNMFRCAQSKRHPPAAHCCCSGCCVPQNRTTSPRAGEGYVRGKNRGQSPYLYEEPLER